MDSHINHYPLYVFILLAAPLLVRLFIVIVHLKNKPDNDALINWFNYSTEAALQRSLTGNILKANRAATQLFGFSIDELKDCPVAQPLPHLQYHRGSNALQFIIKAAEESQGKAVQMPAAKINGEIFNASLLLTSSKKHPDIEKCYAPGVNSYIVKPVQFESFANAIKNLGFYWLLLNQPTN